MVVTVTGKCQDSGSSDLDSLPSTGNKQKQRAATVKATVSGTIIYSYFCFLVLGILKRSFSTSGRERHSQTRYVCLEEQLTKKCI